MKLRDEAILLRQRLMALEDKLERVIILSKNMDQLNAKHCTLLSREVHEAFDRIKHLELTVFPNLARDIQDVHDIIGEGENKADNPLDHRKK